MAAVLEAAGPGPGSALDVGMGPGRLCEALAATAWTVSGVDASAQMVHAARERLPGAADRLLQGYIESVPFPDAVFDLVTATGVIEYSDPRVAIAEIARVVRPGGLAVISYPNPAAAYGLWKSRVWYPGVRILKRAAGVPHHQPRGGRPVAPRRLQAILATSGLALSSTTYAGYMILPTPFDSALPTVAVLLARTAERRRVAAPVLGTQIVYAARKR